MNDIKNIGETKNKNRNLKTFWIYFLSMVSCFLLLILFHFTENGTIKSVAPLLIGLAIVLIFALYLNWIWYKNMDEFEILALGKASIWGIGSTTIIVPWMVLERIGIISEPDPYLIVLFAYTITLVFYYYQKFSSR